MNNKVFDSVASLDEIHVKCKISADIIDSEWNSHCCTHVLSDKLHCHARTQNTYQTNALVE